MPDTYGFWRGSVYFIQDLVNKEIKIGFTCSAPHNYSLADRARNLASVRQARMAILGGFEGTKETEAEMHKRFEHLSVGHEWFRPGDDLLQFIRDQFPNRDPILVPFYNNKQWPPRRNYPGTLD